MPTTQVSRSADILEPDSPPPYSEAPTRPPQHPQDTLSAQLSSNNPWVSVSRNSHEPLRPTNHLIMLYPSSNLSPSRTDLQFSTSSRDSCRPEALINRSIPPEQTSHLSHSGSSQSPMGRLMPPDPPLPEQAPNNVDSRLKSRDPFRDIVAPPKHPTPLPSPAPGYSPFVFPKAFGFYHATGSFSDLVVALSSDNSRSQPQYYISTHGSFSSQPDVILHSSPRDNSPPLATADFHSFSSTIDFSIHIGTIRITSALKKKEAFSNTFAFTLPIDFNGCEETFEWKKSHGNEVRALNGGHRGMKLVRVKDGKIVVAWSTPSNGTHKKGKMEFLGGCREELGQVWEVAVVISVLGLMESGRRSRNGAMGAAGVAGGAAC